MISSLLNYRLYTDNLAKTLERVEAGGTVARDAQYYKDHIGKVSTVDEFLGDQRLYAYALKAYGLEDQISSKAFIRKVLQSDLSDTASFANKLVDNRYRTFASAFDFRAAKAAPAVQSANQTDVLVEAYSEHRVRSAVSAAAKTAHYEERIATVGTVDDLLADPVMFEMLAKTLGLDPALADRAVLRAALVAPRPDDPATDSDDALAGLHSRFNFAADGTAVGGVAQAADAVGDFIYRYNKATGNLAGSGSAAHEAKYLADTIRSGTLHGQPLTAGALVGDERLFNFVLTAYGLDPSTESAARIQNVLEGQPVSVEVAKQALYAALAAAFNFQSDGSILPGETAQTPAANDDTTRRYYARYQEAASTADVLATNSFRIRLSTMKSLNDLLANSPVYGRDALTFVLKAFDLDPAVESLSKIRKVLGSDASDPASFVNRLKDERYERLAAAFNFDASGKLRAERLVQSVANQQKVASLYTASFGTPLSSARSEIVKRDAQSYLESVGSLRTLDDFLADKKTVAFALKAFDLDGATTSTAELRRILTSDLGDKASYANTLANRSWRDFAASFNFTPDGRVSLAGEGVQSAGARFTTDNLFLLQTLEEQAGETSEGARLALYFLRKAPEIKSAYSLLADRALFEVARTALGLPDSVAQLDIEIQAKILEKRIAVADLADPKKLDKFISRFASLYDQKNAGTDPSGIMALFGGGSNRGSGILALL